MVTSQTYAARVVHSNNKFDYIAVYKLYQLKVWYTINFEMLMCMTYTTSQDEKATLRVLMRLQDNGTDFEMPICVTHEF